MKFIITGPPLSGKTTFLKQLQKLNFKIFIADEFVEKLYQKGNVGYDLIKLELGENFLTPQKVDKKLLALEVTKNPETLIKLNQLIHPLIEKEFNETDYLIGEIPLTISTNINILYDKIILLKPKNIDVIKSRINSTERQINKKFIEFILSKWNDDKINFDYIIEVDKDFNLEEEISKFLKHFELN